MILSILDAGVLIISSLSKIVDVLFEHGGLPYILHLTVHLKETALDFYNMTFIQIEDLHWVLPALN